MVKQCPIVVQIEYLQPDLKMLQCMLVSKKKKMICDRKKNIKINIKTQNNFKEYC